jgi:hypothetical protein
LATLRRTGSGARGSATSQHPAGPPPAPEHLSSPFRARRDPPAIQPVRRSTRSTPAAARRLPGSPMIVPDMTDIPDLPAFDEAAAMAEIVNIQPVPHPTANSVGTAFEKGLAASFLKVTSLPPAERPAIQAELNRYAPGPARDAREAELVQRALSLRTEPQRAMRALTHGNEYAKAQAQLHLDVRERDREVGRLLADLEAVARYETTTGPDGQPVPSPVMKLQGYQRKAAADRVATLEQEIALLQGPEWARRREKALAASLEAKRAEHQRQAEQIAARQMADRIASDERIEAQARVYARARKSFN